MNGQLQNSRSLNLKLLASYTSCQPRFTPKAIIIGRYDHKTVEIGSQNGPSN